MNYYFFADMRLEKENFMLKTDKHVRKLSRILVLLAVLMVSAMLVLASVRAEGTATIWTDKADYSPGETVTIYGSGFVADACVTITVTRPDSSMDTWSVTADSSGAFTTTYLLDGITGTYLVTATDGTNTATTTFADTFAVAVSLTCSPSETEVNIPVTITVTASGGTQQCPAQGILVYLVTSALGLTSPTQVYLTGTDSVASASFIYTPLGSVGCHDITACGSAFYIDYDHIASYWPSPSPSTSLYVNYALQPPTVTARPQYILQGESSSLTSSPVTTGTGSYSYQWFERAPDASSYSAISGATSSSYTFSTTTSTTTGLWYFKLQVTDSVNAVTISHGSVWVRAADNTPPTTIDNYDGLWHKADFTITLTSTDDMSGVAATSYKINGGATKTVSVDGQPSITTESATNSLEYWSVDVAGNEETHHTLTTIKLDKTAPTLAASYPAANSYGWYNTAVTVDFTTTDGLSGIDTFSGDVTLSGEGEGQSATATATDKAGNSASLTIDNIDIDMTPPTITGSRSPAANSWGWNNVDVTVSFAVDDALSGVDPATIPSDIVLSGEGAGQSVTGTAVDKAGNSATTTVGNINIDKTAPVVSLAADRAPDSNGWYNHEVSFTVSATDALSGIDATLTVTPPAYSDPDSSSITVTGSATDKAGNTASASLTFKYDATVSETALTIGEPKWGTDPINVLLTTPFSLSATDATSGVATTQYSFDQTSSWTTYTGPFTAPSIGSHTLYYRSTDNAGNVEPYKFVKMFVADLTVDTGFKAGDSPSFASDPYITEIMCVMVKATNGYKLAGTAPGTCDYAIAIKNIGTTTFTSIKITIYGDPDFNLQSSNPIRVLDANGADTSAQFTIDTTLWLTSQKITITSKSGFQLPPSASLYVTVHLDYKLKGKDSFPQFYSRGYRFQTSIEGTSGGNSGTTDTGASVAFLSKKVTVIYGFAKTSSGAPIAGAKINLYQGTTLIKTDYTDTDGFYSFIDGWESVVLTDGVTFTVECYLPMPDGTFIFLASQSVTAKSLQAVIVNFTKKE